MKVWMFHTFLLRAERRRVPGLHPQGRVYCFWMLLGYVTCLIPLSSSTDSGATRLPLNTPDPLHASED